MKKKIEIRAIGWVSVFAVLCAALAFGYWWHTHHVITPQLSDKEATAVLDRILSSPISPEEQPTEEGVFTGPLGVYYQAASQAGDTPLRVYFDAADPDSLGSASDLFAVENPLGGTGTYHIVYYKDSKKVYLFQGGVGPKGERIVFFDPIEGADPTTFVAKSAADSSDKIHTYHAQIKWVNNLKKYTTL